MKLNIGCGDNKIAGYTNIDSYQGVRPDIVINVCKEPLPFADNSIDEILLFHTIEHIEERYHAFLLNEFWRVLKPNCELYISYPEFKICAQNYINNYKGHKDFWKATIYGLQRYPGDYHVSLMDTDTFIDTLHECGFKDIQYKPESMQLYNTILKTAKGEKMATYEDLIVDLIYTKRNGK